MTNTITAFVVMFGGLIMHTLTADPLYQWVFWFGVALVGLNLVLDIANTGLRFYRWRLERRLATLQREHAKRATPPSSL